MPRPFSCILFLLLALCTSDLFGQGEGGRSAVSVRQGMSASQRLRSYLRSQGLVEYRYDSISLYSNGKDKFSSMFQDIARARKSIDVEYFIYADDSIANAMTVLLTQKAREGVQVRLVIDSYKDVSRSYGHTQLWCDSMFRAYLKPATHSELEESYFAARLFDPWQFPFVNHIARDHRKIVVIDDEIGYIGGLNVADYYLHGKPEFGGWRDTHMRVTGEAVLGLNRYFEEAWERCGGQCRSAFLADSSQGVGKDLAAMAQEPSSASSPHTVIYFERSRENHQKKAETRRAIVAALESARDSVHIVSPYFLPTHSVRKALIDCLDRGVKVDVMFSKVGDEKLLSVGNYDFSRRLIRHGATVHLYRGSFHHSKIMMIDGEVSMVGSANLNSRSLRWDYEASAFVFCAEVTHRLDSVFAQDLQHCDRFSLPLYHEEQSTGTRLLGWFVNRFLTPIL